MESINAEAPEPSKGDDLLEGLETRPKLPPVPIHYFVALVGAGLGVGALISLYFGAILALVFFSVDHAVLFFLKMGRQTTLLGSLGHLTSLSFGFVCAATLCRPFLRKFRKSAPAFVLKEQDQPRFFAFLRGICHATDAAFPNEVVVDCQGNASVAMAGGFRGLWNRKVSLHVGLPLALRLNTRQLAGVIAHETGHLTQDSGMRLSFWIRSLLDWLGRNVEERDSWDDLIDAKLERGGIVTRAVFRGLAGLLWCAKGVSWLIWRAGQLICSHLLRQMEYHSDRYECAVAGSEIFEETAFRVTLMDTAESFARRKLSDTFKNGRLPDQYPDFVSGVAERFTDEQLSKFYQTLQNARELWLDSHPSYSRRVQEAKEENAPGIYHVEQPAQRLFRNFDQLARNVTLHFYRKRLQLATEGLVLVPTEQFLEESFIDDVGMKMLFDLLGESVAYLAPVNIPDQAGPNDPPTRDLEDLRPDLERSVDAYVDAKGRLDDLRMACAFGENDMRMPDAPDGGDMIRIRKRLKPAEFQTGEARRRAEIFLEELGRWFRLRIDTLPEDLKEPAGELVVVLNAVSAASEPTQEAMRQAVVLFELVENIALHTEYETILRQASRLSVQIQELLEEALSGLSAVPYPYDHVKPDATVRDYARRPGHEGEAKIIQAYQSARHQSERLSSLYLRLLQDLVLLTVQGNKRD